MFLIFVFFFLVVQACSMAHLPARRECSEACAPAGAFTQNLPPIGPELARLYSDIINTVDNFDDGSVGTGPTKRQASIVTFCCAANTDCLLLDTYGLPFCWDRFTTNFAFPDGSYGSTVLGTLETSSGTKVDLIYGNYTNKDGSTGTIYEDVMEKPDTTTMKMPAPFTSSGVGSAIPATELGGLGTVTAASATISLQGGTGTAITLPSLTITAGPNACHLCSANHTTSPETNIMSISTGTSTSTNTTTTPTMANATNSTSGASIIWPPINTGWVPFHRFAMFEALGAVAAIMLFIGCL